MALPATGSTISMGVIRDYFVSAAGGSRTSSYTISVLGTYIGISAGTTILMSDSFGGYFFWDSASLGD
tara:strand:- start:689 stop:892 length:204 start_codon:yes stop_codon:yes gene_type:complete